MTEEGTTLREREYLLAHHILDSESSRAWTRFSILIGGQFALLGGFLAGHEGLSHRQELAIVALAFMVVVSGAVVNVVTFGKRTTRAGLAVLDQLEAESEGAFRILALAKKHVSWERVSRTHRTAVFLAYCFAGLWLILLAMQIRTLA